MPKKIFTQELEGTKRRGRPRKGWREEVERDLQVLGVRRWKELVTGQNGGTLFDWPKPTTGCSANGRRRRIVIRCNWQHSRFVFGKYPVRISALFTRSRKMCVWLKEGRPNFSRLSRFSRNSCGIPDHVTSPADSWSCLKQGFMNEAT